MTTLINSLHEFVTPDVLSATQSFEGSDANKKDVLTTLYSIIAARLTDTHVVKRIETLTDIESESAETLLTASIYDKDAPVGFTTGLYDTIAANHNVPATTVNALSAAALPKAYRHIKQLAGTYPVADYLSNEREGLIAGIPAWAVAALPAGLWTTTSVNPLVADTKAAPVATGVLTKEEKPSGSAMKALLPIVGALIFAGLAFMLLKACQKEPTPVAAPVSAPVATTDTSSAAIAPAMFTASLNETGTELYSCGGEVGNAGLADTLRSHVAGVFQNQNCAFTTTAVVANDMPAAQYIPQILGFMKGVPDASVTISDKSILLNASDAAALEKLISDIKGMLPSDFTVAAEPVIDEVLAISNSITAAGEALDAITDTPNLDELVRALNLQIINFAVDSTEIPAENKAILDKAALRLKELPEAHLAITGHTDNQGTLEYNQDLSERRAKAVHDYLVSQGVNDDKLDTSGASYTRPVATNATEQGRFRNRRIEFTISNAGQTVDTIGSATVSLTDTATDTAKDAAGTVADTAAAATGAVVDTAKNAAATVSDAASSAAGTVTTTNK